MVSKRVEPVLEEFSTYVKDAAIRLTATEFMVAPPMYRHTPTWYREGMPEVLTRFSTEIYRDRPPNLHLLPSFPTPEFEADGIHLTAYSGMEFVLHLFDSAIGVLDAAKDGYDLVVPRVGEATRLLEDRMVAIEQDHRRLNKVIFIIV